MDIDRRPTKPRKPSKTAQAPTTFGHYRILRKLGQGGMGIVYAAHDERLDRQVALKTIRPSKFGGTDLDRSATKRLWREARAAAAFNHPGVCQMYDIGEERGQVYVVMELLEGESLADRITRGPCDAPFAIRTMIGILDALGALHGKNLIHRDLKPSNIFLTPHGVKLLDFGLARKMWLQAPAADECTETMISELDALAGTPGYLSPEQLLGKQADARSDLFAGGVILFEMLAGRLAFQGANKMAIFHAVLHEQPPTLSDCGAIALTGVDSILRRALEKKPEDRYQTAEGISRELRALMLRENVTRRPPSQPQLKRLIVLPFRMLRPDPEFDFLSYSLPDAITNSLLGLSRLVVRSSMAAAKYAGHSPDLKTVAAETQVDVVLTGTVLRAGNQLRVVTQLAEAPEGAILWSQTSQVGLGDIFQLEDELVQRVVKSLEVPLTGTEGQLLRHDVPANPIAYEYFLRANELSTDWRNYPTARDLYLRCTEMDPGYAPAWAQLGRCYRVIAKYGGDEEDFTRSEAAFQRAFSLNSGLSLAHHLYTYLEADMGRARQAMVKLLNLTRRNGNDPGLFAGLVHVCRYCGLLNSSMAAHERVRVLDPQLATSVAHSWFMAGDYERVLDTRSSSGAKGNMVTIYAMALMGKEAQALDLVREDEKSLEVLLAREHTLHHQLIYSLTAAMRALLEGKREESLSALRKSIQGRRGEELYYITRSLARLEATDEALFNLERSVEFGFVCHPTLIKDPWLDSLRAEKRFTAVLRRAEEHQAEARRMFIEAGGMGILGEL